MIFFFWGMRKTRVYRRKVTKNSNKIRRPRPQSLENNTMLIFLNGYKTVINIRRNFLVHVAWFNCVKILSSRKQHSETSFHHTENNFCVLVWFFLCLVHVFWLSVALEHQSSHMVFFSYIFSSENQISNLSASPMMKSVWWFQTLCPSKHILIFYSSSMNNSLLVIRYSCSISKVKNFLYVTFLGWILGIIHV